MNISYIFFNHLQEKHPREKGIFNLIDKEMSRVNIQYIMFSTVEKSVMNTYCMQPHWSVIWMGIVCHTYIDSNDKTHL